MMRRQHDLNLNEAPDVRQLSVRFAVGARPNLEGVNADPAD
jgi:hypothetical protein